MEKQTTMSFLRWLFKDSHKSLSFWGFVTVISSAVMLYTGCPAPWPLYVMIAGVSLTVIDAGIAWYRFSRAVYQMEQDRIMRELKNNSVDQ